MTKELAFKNSVYTGSCIRMLAGGPVQPWDVDFRLSDRFEKQQF